VSFTCVAQSAGLELDPAPAADDGEPVVASPTATLVATISASPIRDSFRGRRDISINPSGDPVAADTRTNQAKSTNVSYLAAVEKGLQGR
jgi:hypothetical protein